MYFRRMIDEHLAQWAQEQEHKPLLLRGARQVGKSSAVRQLGKTFANYVEINFERNPEYKSIFINNLDVNQIVPHIVALSGQKIIAGSTLLFLDEIQACPNALMSLRFFKEDMPQLHVIAAGSLLELALEELPTFGVGRIQSMFMHPMTFDEFLEANSEDELLNVRNQATPNQPLLEPLHNRLVSLLRTYIMVGGMPEVVTKWVQSHNYLHCQKIQDSLLLSYEDDFPKYRKRVNPTLLRQTLRSVALQSTKKFTYAQVGDYKAQEVKTAIEMLSLAGLVVPVVHSAANGLPLGSEVDSSYRKMMLLDTGLTLRALNMSLGNYSEMTAEILTASQTDLVNKGPMAEQVVGLVLHRMSGPFMRDELFYWQRQARNSQAEIDYLIVNKGKILPCEVKAETQGGMKSLWNFMREKQLTEAVRCSLENFGEYDYVDNEADGARRHVKICPLYAISRLYEIANG